MKYSIDGGKTYHEATEGVRVVYEDILIPGEDSTGELHAHFTHEGLILDVWMNDETSSNIGTSSQTTDQIVIELIEND